MWCGELGQYISDSRSDFSLGKAGGLEPAIKLNILENKISVVSDIPAQYSDIMRKQVPQL